MALKRNPNPTFVHPVEIPVPGEKPEKVDFTFRHKTKTAYQQFLVDCVGRSDTENALEIVSGWGLNEEFGQVSKESIEALFEEYLGAPGAVFMAYSQGLHQGRLGN